MKRWWLFVNAGFLLLFGWFVLGFLSEPSAVHNVRVALIVMGVGSILLGITSAAVGVWMLVARRT
jgi:nitrate reductase gamma subunit